MLKALLFRRKGWYVWDKPVDYMHQEFLTINDLLIYVQQSGGGDLKGVCELGELPSALVARVQNNVGINMQGFRLTLDSYGIRHAFGGHSQDWGSRDHYPLTDADILSLPGWVFAPTTILEGATRAPLAQPRRLRLEYVDSQQLKIVLILEVRPRYRRLVLVTMYKTKNG